ncbi:Ferrous-iron efflux pump FieF [Roseivivax sp. THAF40]|uniref:cation diffusion facilitator family transporter n=1 Tax=unclassified Roseivivax TaxID=2639302 RepID=UPI001268DC30|nr:MULTISPECIES: cation diffusion facilitator family transporter [unclassified Roseivivax]QFS83884.1 Ferrous-iron efflux pump FieF [Roseivivax sp. THAF197b]QFT47716.1 Ferrous-iron efflux pump FieF [Roseivivax sp. THAF40]
MTKTARIAAISVLVGIVVLAVKTLAWWVTGSVALLSDALESIVNVATALAALIAVRIADRPPDADHPYGHHKAELFSAIIEGVLIILAALFILREAWDAFFDPREIAAPWTGLAINLAASVLNGIWAFVLIRQGRALRSPALAADGRHLLTDIVSSIGVAFGIAAATLTGWLWLDPALAAFVALNILWAGYHVISGSVGGLMDKAVPEEHLNALRELISEHAEGAIEAHDLRTRHAGRHTFIEFHLIVPGEMSVHDAHQICDRIEAALRQVVPDCTVNIHVEPEHKAKHSGIVVL